MGFIAFIHIRGKSINSVHGLYSIHDRRWFFFRTLGVNYRWTSFFTLLYLGPFQSLSVGGQRYAWVRGFPQFCLCSIVLSPSVMNHLDTKWSVLHHFSLQNTKLHFRHPDYTPRARRPKQQHIARPPRPWIIPIPEPNLSLTKDLGLRSSSSRTLSSGWLRSAVSYCGCGIP